MKCPCKDCDRRKLGCHGFCKEYKEWQKWNDEKNEKRRKEMSDKDCHSNAFKKQISRSMRRR